MDYPEGHHYLFYISQLIIIFILGYFYNSFAWNGTQLSKFLFLILILTFLIFFSLMLVYVHLSKIFLKKNYEIHNPVSFGDLLLTAPIIVVSFFMQEFYRLEIFSNLFYILLSIFFIIGTYFFLVKFTEYVSKLL